MKVIDRRMFTPDGELREEYRDRVDPDRVPPSQPSPASTSVAADRSAPVATADPAPATQHATEPAVDPRRETEAAPEEPGKGPTFNDLVAFLAQTAAAYLQQAHQGNVGGAMSASEMLEMAKLHCDLLDVLARKTEGNITAQERAILDDARRQLRLAVG